MSETCDRSLVFFEYSGERGVKHHNRNSILRCYDKPLHSSEQVASSQQKTSGGSTRGTQVFDSMSKKKSEKQPPSQVIMKNSKPVLKKVNSRFPF